MNPKDEDSTRMPWQDERCLKLTVIGYKSSLMSVRELWQAVFSKTFVFLSLLVGTVAALSMTIGLQVMGDPTLPLQVLIIFFPVAVNLLACLAVTGLSYLAMQRRKAAERRIGVIKLSLTLVMFVISAASVAAINIPEALGGGLQMEPLTFVLVASPFVYVLVADHLFYVVFEYIAPSLWGRDHIRPDSADQPGSSFPLFDQTQPGAQRKIRAMDGWSERRCLRIWISGYRSSYMSIKELWAIVFSKTILALSIIVGSAAGVTSAIMLQAVGDPTYYVLLFFSVAPILVNIGSASIMSGLVFLKLSRLEVNDQPNAPTIVIPSSVTILLSLLPQIAGMYLVKVTYGGLGEDWFFVIMAVVPAMYVVISDFFHYIVFRYISPGIWGRPHILTAGESPKAPTVSDEIQHVAPVADDLIQIGETQVQRNDVLFLEAQGNYLRIVTEKEEFLERFRISEADEILGKNFGVFLHRSRWVAFTGIDRVEQTGSQYQVKMRNQEVLSIASTRIGKVLDLFARNRISVMKASKPDDQPT